MDLPRALAVFLAGAVIGISLFTGPAIARNFACDVTKVQEKLKEMGHDPGPVDGVWGRKTREAVVQLQLDTGLPQTGTLDTETCAALIGKNSATAGIGKVAKKPEPKQMEPSTNAKGLGFVCSRTSGRMDFPSEGKIVKLPPQTGTTYLLCKVVYKTGPHFTLTTEDLLLRNAPGKVIARAMGQFPMRTSTGFAFPFMPGVQSIGVFSDRTGSKLLYQIPNGSKPHMIGSVEITLKK